MFENRACETLVIFEIRLSLVSFLCCHYLLVILNGTWQEDHECLCVY